MDNLILPSTFHKNTLVKIKTIFVLMKGFHLPQRQITEAANGGALKEKCS